MIGNKIRHQDKGRIKESENFEKIENYEKSVEKFVKRLYSIYMFIDVLRVWLGHDPFTAFALIGMNSVHIGT